MVVIKSCWCFCFGSNGSRRVDKRDRYRQPIFGSNRKKAETFFLNITAQNNFEVIILFYCLSLFSDELQNNTLMVPHKYRASSLIGICGQRSLNIWRKLLRKSPSSIQQQHVSVPGTHDVFQGYVTCITAESVNGCCALAEDLEKAAQEITLFYSTTISVSPRHSRHVSRVCHLHHSRVRWWMLLVCSAARKVWTLLCSIDRRARVIRHGAWRVLCSISSIHWF